MPLNLYDNVRVLLDGDSGAESLRLLGGRDIYPDNDGRGLWARFVNKSGLGSYNDHFRSGVIPTGYAWAPTSGVMTAPTPGYLIYCVGSDYIWNAAAASGQRNFMYKAVTNAAANWQGSFMSGRFRTGSTTEAGFRLDNGNSAIDQPFAEVYMSGALNDGRQRLDFRWRDTVGGAINVTTSGIIIPCDQFMTIMLVCYGTAPNLGIGGYLLSEDGATVNIANFSTAFPLGWIPCAGRAGLFWKESGNWAACDWFLNIFS